MQMTTFIAKVKRDSSYQLFNTHYLYANVSNLEKSKTVNVTSSVTFHING